VKDYLNIAYGGDVLEQTIATMSSFDPEWKVLEGFFPAMANEIVDK
jgi:hypothetical protein